MLAALLCNLETREPPRGHSPVSIAGAGGPRIKWEVSENKKRYNGQDDRDVLDIMSMFLTRRR